MVATSRADILIEINAPHFYCGLVARDGVVVTTAPIVAWMKGKRVVEVRAYCRRKGWRATNHEVLPKRTAGVDR